jgi:hypothetical protein
VEVRVFSTAPIINVTDCFCEVFSKVRESLTRTGYGPFDNGLGSGAGSCLERFSNVETGRSSMPTNRDMDALVRLAKDVRLRPEWTAFAEFCELRGHGRRTESLQRLGVFLTDAASWPFDARLDFVKYILEKSDSVVDRSILLPQTICERLLVPTLRQWAASAPYDALPHLWLGLLRCDVPAAHLEHALELNPSCYVARKTLTEWILGEVEYNQHELPAFYIHDPRHDLEKLDRADVLVSPMASDAWVAKVKQEIAELREQAKSWLAAHPGESDFAIH